MIIVAIFIGIILIFFVCLTFYIRSKKDGKYDDGVTLGMIITLLAFIEYILINCIIGDIQPTAMDVYQNKTTLEYKVVDGVKVDSVVVFKNEDYGKN